VSRQLVMVFLAATALAWGAAGARAEDVPLQITLQHGRFDPPELVVPANAACQVRVTNADPTAIEFESFELHRERVVQPGESITVYLPALAPGRYPFFDDFHHDSTQGAIVAE
jgi:Cupredoxin-like domain